MGVVTMDQALPFQCSARVSGRLFRPEPAKPTAQQSEALRQASPDKALVCDGLVLGVATIDHTLPFHCKAKVCSGRPLLLRPTAQQSEELMQATPWRSLVGELVLGVVTMDHVLPFQCSARVWVATEPMLEIPTAQQSEVLTQATPSRRLVGELVLGVVTMDQALPFQCSARVSSEEPLPLSAVPTAQQSELLTQPTPMRSLASEGLVLGVVTKDQALPFQCWATLWTVPPLKKVPPTAQQSDSATQATPDRGVFPGAETSDQVIRLAPAAGVAARALTATVATRNTVAAPARIKPRRLAIADPLLPGT